MPKKYYSQQIVKDFITKTAGEGALQLIDIYHKKGKAVTDEEVAKKMKLKVTEVRALLNRLHYRGISQYQKTRDTESGWYSYTWDINPKRIIELIMEEQIEELQKLEKQKQNEEGYSYFGCVDGCSTIPFEIAAEYQFRCPDCGKSLDVINNEEKIKGLKKKITKMEKQINQFKEL